MRSVTHGSLRSLIGKVGMTFGNDGDVISINGDTVLCSTGSVPTEDDGAVFVMTDDQGDGVAGDDGEYLETYSYG